MPMSQEEGDQIVRDAAQRAMERDGAPGEPLSNDDFTHFVQRSVDARVMDVPGFPRATAYLEGRDMYVCVSPGGQDNCWSLGSLNPES